MNGLMERIRVFILDNHLGVRQALAARLQSSPAIEVVGTSGTRRWLVSKRRMMIPQVAILGLAGGNEPSEDCLMLVRRLTQQGTAVLALASYIDDRVREKILQDGARRCLLKNINTPQLIAEIEQVAAEREIMPPPPPASGWPLTPS
ncbi:MAG: response regulator transcription factor [Chloroflexi bacterium]|nr:response regulator transcription factor [Chloroflexota bacterium]